MRNFIYGQRHLILVAILGSYHFTKIKGSLGVEVMLLIDCYRNDAELMEKEVLQRLVRKCEH